MKKKLERVVAAILILVLLVCVDFGYKVVYFYSFMKDSGGLIPYQPSFRSSLSCYIWNSAECKKTKSDINNFLDGATTYSQNIVFDIKKSNDCMPRDVKTKQLFLDTAVKQLLENPECSHYKSFIGDTLYLSSIKGILLNIDINTYDQYQDKIKNVLNNSLSNVAQNEINAVEYAKNFQNVLNNLMPKLIVNDYINSYTNFVQNRLDMNQVIILELDQLLDSKQKLIDYKVSDKYFFTTPGVKTFNCSDLVLLNNMFQKVDKIDDGKCVISHVDTVSQPQGQNTQHQEEPINNSVNGINTTLDGLLKK